MLLIKLPLTIGLVWGKPMGFNIANFTGTITCITLMNSM